jgi:hypothetical protein
LRKQKDKLYIGITGSKYYENKAFIKDVIFKLKENLNDDFVIVSKGNENGADKCIKKTALQLNCSYEEYTPLYLQRNLYSLLPCAMHGKEFTIKECYQRNKMIASRISAAIIFQYKEDPEILHLIKILKNKNIKTQIFYYNEEVGNRRD